MKRIFLFCLISAILGTLSYGSSVNPFIMCLITLIISIFIKNKPLRIIALLSVIVYMSSYCRISLMENDTSNLNFEEQSQSLKGQINSFPFVKDQVMQFTIKLEEQEEVVQAFIHDNSNTLSYGDQIDFTAKIREPNTKRNPGGFDYSKYLKARHIKAVIYIEDDSIISIEEGPVSIIERAGRTFRQGFVTFFNQNFTIAQGDFLRGLILGEKAMGGDTTESFNKLGISHILSVSGLHVGYVYLVITFICKLLRLNKTGKLALTSFLLYMYCFIVGFSSPVMRASLMALMSIASERFNKKFDTFNVVCILALGFILYNPYFLFDVGFQLSYIAVISIAVIYPYLNNKIQCNNKFLVYVKSLLLLTSSVQLGTLPVVLYHFNNFSLLSLVANLLVVPVTGFIIVGCILTYFISVLCLPVRWIAVIIGFAADFCLKTSEFLSAVPYGFYNLPPMSLLVTIIYYSALFALLGYFYIYNKRNRNLLTALLIVNISILLIFHFTPKPLTVTFLDVGQGDCAILECPGDFNMLIDGGGQKDYSIGDNIVAKALLNKNIRSLDLVICTHSHDDHKLGLIEIMDDIKIDMIVINSLEETQYDDLIATAGLFNIPVYRNHQISIDLGDDMRFDLIYPDDDTMYIDENNSSIVAKLAYKDVGFLFTGDLEREGESILIEGGYDLSSDIIKIGHHGSKTSTSNEFIAEVNPEYAIISVGQNNFYNHPNDEVINLLHNENIEILRTDFNGAIEVMTDGEDIVVKKYVK